MRRVRYCVGLGLMGLVLAVSPGVSQAEGPRVERRQSLTPDERAELMRPEFLVREEAMRERWAQMAEQRERAREMWERRFGEGAGREGGPAARGPMGEGHRQGPPAMREEGPNRPEPRGEARGEGRPEAWREGGRVDLPPHVAALRDQISRLSPEERQMLVMSLRELAMQRMGEGRGERPERPQAERPLPPRPQESARPQRLDRPERPAMPNRPAMPERPARPEGFGPHPHRGPQGPQWTPRPQDFWPQWPQWTPQPQGDRPEAPRGQAGGSRGAGAFPPVPQDGERPFGPRFERPMNPERPGAAAPSADRAAEMERRFEARLAAMEKRMAEMREQLKKAERDDDEDDEDEDDDRPARRGERSRR